MIVSLLMVFMLFAAMVVNVGQAVNRRIALQMLADAGAWTGATNQAIGLNKLAELNLYMQEFWILLTMAEGNFDMTICEIGDPALATYYSSWQTLNRMFDTVNRWYPRKAYDEARRITVYNLADLFPGERWRRFTMAGPGALGGWLASVSPVLPAMPTSPLASQQVPAWWVKNWQCVVLTPPATGVVLPRLATFVGSGLWYTKMSRSPTSFWWYVKAPASRALLFDEIFGPNAIPEMEAVGAAKPVGGNIGVGQQQYVTKLVPVAEALANDRAAWALITPPPLTTHLRAYVLDSYGGVTRRRAVTH